MKIINDLNLKKQAHDLGIKIWQTPGFMFIMLGMVAVVIMTATFFIAQNYDSPELVVFAESSVVIIVLIIGNSVISLVEQILKVNRMKSEFVSVASHQLRTPLSAIRWETELLLSKYRKSVSVKQQKSIENINALSVRMTHLVNDLLDVARIDQDKLIIRKIEMDIFLPINEIITENRLLAKSKHMEITFDAKKKLPLVFADPEKIRMVIENLFNNAIKYTIDCGKIEIRLNKKNGMLIFSIKDNGVGIPKEQHKRIFEKFFRSDNVAKYQTDGTGLGLYIAKNIIEQMGGKIWFKSVENAGSVFSFSVPIVKKKVNNFF
jgi:signal transduction histidine kinase